MVALHACIRVVVWFVRTQYIAALATVESQSLSNLPLAAACIGPISAAAARELGFAVVEAAPHSVTGLLDAVVAWAVASPPTT